ncbi:MAG: hypothetical protein Q9191_005097 [Dirinaria sp. TL-2023a]
MPSRTTPLRRRREDTDDDLDFSGVANGVTSGSGSKKARLSVNGNPSRSSQRTPSSNNYVSARHSGLQAEPLRAEPTRRKHQPGAIVRVKLANFVTYTAVEFLPGPSLNMVIGPNGTGKSTLVCAICLGLGWGAQHLGRAKDVAEYVKHGCQDALIEIELAGDGTFKRNPVVQCKIARDGNKSTFTINGKTASRKQVQELARHFSIQIDNLCQFLPQDKVVEFAAMTPVELLRSTQRAVAPQEMLDMHENLKELRKQQKMVEAENNSNQETLTNLETRQRMQQADVERMRERNEIKRRIEFLERSRPIWQYRDARAAHEEAKNKKVVAAKELDELEAEVEPSLRAVNAKQAYQDQIEAAIKERGHIVKQAERTADATDQKIKGLCDRLKELGHEREAEANGGKKSRSDVARLQGSITRLKKQMEEPPPELDVSSFNEQIREKNRKIEDLRQTGFDIKKQQEEKVRLGTQKNARILQAQQDLKSLDSQAGQMMTKLSRISPDSYKAWQWVQNNQDQFEKRVFGPVMIECSIKDPKWVDMIESLFGRSTFITFTVQTKNDLKKFMTQVHEVMGLSEINTRMATASLEEFQHPCSDEELSRYGLDGWASDFISGPEPVLVMLYPEIRLHLTAVGWEDTTPEQYDMLSTSRIDNWATSKSTYKIVRRREYGSSAVSAHVGNNKPATIWTDQPVDIGAKRELQESIEGWSQEVKAFENENKELQAQLHHVRDQIQSKREEVDRMTEEKSARQKAIGVFKGLPTKLEQEQQKLSTAQESLAGVRERIKAIQEQVDKVTLQRGQAALDYANAVEALREAHNTLYTAEVMHIEATSEVETLIQRNSSVKTLLENKRKEVRELTSTAENVRKEAKRLMKICTQIINVQGAAEPAFSAFLQELPTDADGAHMEEEISSEKARLELMHEGNGGVIKEYEQRQKRVEALKAKEEECNHALQELGAKITELRGNWEPELDNLVEKISRSFSYNMQQINCAGEVGVFKDEQDFDDWAIQIRVKFRENEPLSLLDSHRQSGGERAVSTIFYLMSLQSLTRSPFRVVDEINQGMDPRNERLVHKRMVNIACGNGDIDGDEFRAQGIDNDVELDGESADGQQRKSNAGSQYFLITPKLLNGLEYARGMRVLCIVSGEYMPQEHSKIDFGKCVDIARGLKGLGPSSVAAAG